MINAKNVTGLMFRDRHFFTDSVFDVEKFNYLSIGSLSSEAY